MIEALPCIVCGGSLHNQEPSGDNDPLDGLVFETEGGYGSEVFDPMDGSVLQVNICDACITRAGKQGRVHTGRHRRPVHVYLDDSDVPFHVGWERTTYLPVEWHKDLAGYLAEDACVVEPEEVGNFALSKNIEWYPEAVETVKNHISKSVPSSERKLTLIDGEKR